MTDDKPVGPVLSIRRLRIWETAVPTIKGWTFDTSQGPLNFHANREQLQLIGDAFLKAAREMPSKTDLS
jgi:hypothetical protein